MVRRQWLLGLMATLAVVLLDRYQALNRLEAETLDLRARYFGAYSPGPSSEIALVGIDDASLKNYGRWPWPREQLAEVVRELTRLGARVIALDLLLDNPQEPRWSPDDRSDLEVSRASAQPSGERILEPIKPRSPVRLLNDDEELGRALAEHGSSVLAVKLPYQSSEGGVDVQAVINAVERDAQLRDAGVELGVARLAENLSVKLEFNDPDSPLRQDLLGKLLRARSLLAVESKSSLPLPVEARLWAETHEPQLPIPTLSDSASRLASVTFDSYDADGTVRRVPLWIRHRGRLWPTLGLAAVMEHLGVGMSGVTLLPDATILNDGKGRRIRIPMMRSELRRGPVDGIVYIGWPRASRSFWWRAAAEDVARPDVEDGVVPASGVGSGREKEWKTQLPDAQQCSIGSILQLARLERKIRSNITQLDGMMSVLHETCGEYAPEEVEAYRARASLLEKLEMHGPLFAARLIEQSQVWVTFDARARAAFEAMNLGDADPTDSASAELRSVLDSIMELAPRAVESVRAGVERFQRPAGSDSSEFSFKRLRETVQGRICFVGWVATGGMSDFWKTSIHTQTPGVFVHIALASGILTATLPVQASGWWDILSVLGLGLIGTWLGVRSTDEQSLIAGPLLLAGLLGASFLLNAHFAWDRGRLILAAAAPMVAAAGGWGVVMLHRLLVEQRGRKRTEEKFRSYVSPAVVDILVNNPELTTMEPQERELTVMFSDLAGFTTTSERLGSKKTASILSRYLGEMTDVLQRNRATLDKYLGDGIMSFWGAPVDDPEHAYHACVAAVGMVRRLDELNASGAFEEAGVLHARIGIAAGTLMVGDFGNPPRNSSYTVLGDPANFASRLESANKFFGTRILVSDRVRELVGDRLRFRPIGKLVVKGKEQDVWVHELIGDLAPHGDRTDEWASLTREAVEAYVASRFDDSIRAFDRLAREFGDAELADVYRGSILAQRRGGGVLGPFRGTIVLTEK
ncbi:MAG: CHASE2 domain-containing protein [Phycisphaerae bacterium]|nr:CHASE2 domain-containing protein [Phycisphaerae bacterium]